MNDGAITDGFMWVNYPQRMGGTRNRCESRHLKQNRRSWRRSSARNSSPIRELLKRYFVAGEGVISRAQIAMGRMYIPALKFPVMPHASGVLNQ